MQILQPLKLSWRTFLPSSIVMLLRCLDIVAPDLLLCVSCSLMEIWRSVCSLPLSLFHCHGPLVSVLYFKLQKDWPFFIHTILQCVICKCRQPVHYIRWVFCHNLSCGSTFLSLKFPCSDAYTFLMIVSYNSLLTACHMCAETEIWQLAYQMMDSRIELWVTDCVAWNFRDKAVCAVIIQHGAAKFDGRFCTEQVYVSIYLDRWYTNFMCGVLAAATRLTLNHA